MRSTKAKIHSLLIAVIIMLASTLLFATFSNYAFGITNALDYQEEKTIEIPDLDDDFDDSCVMVIINKKTSQINKEYKKSFFGDCQIESIEDLTYITGNIDEKVYLNKDDFKQILKLNLKNKSKQSVQQTNHKCGRR